MKKVFVAGGASYDKIIYVTHLPEARPGTIFSKGSIDTVGSTGCGKVISLQKLGMETTFHAMLGNDRSGDLVKEAIRQSGSNFMHDVDSQGTEEHVNIMDEDGGRVSIYTKYSTFEPELDWDTFEPVIAGSEYVVLNIINYVRNLIPIAKKYQKEIWCDIHDYDGTSEYYNDFLEAADYIFMSSDRMEDYRDFMEQMIKANKKLVVCTHGKNGATALSADGQCIELPVIENYERVDTNGAGDNFFAGFLYAHSKGHELEICLKYGTLVAGLCICSEDLVNQVLSEELIEQEFQKYYAGKGLNG